MSKASTKKYAAAVWASLALMAWALPAQALYVVGRWDPPYGVPFTNLGWRGEATFEVDACYFTLGNGQFNNGACGGTGSISVVDARVDFYDTADNSAEGTLLWTSGLPSVLSVTFGGGIVTGIATGLFAWQFGPSAFENIDDYEFALKFTGDSVILKNRICEQYKYDKCKEFDVGSSANSGSDRPALTFATVPEPQTLLLMLAGLGGIGLIGRRQFRG